MIYDSSAAKESICFGSFDFTPHSPAAMPSFSSLHEGLGVTFGAFNFHLTPAGTLRLPEQIRSASGGAGTTIGCPGARFPFVRRVVG